MEGQGNYVESAERPKFVCESQDLLSIEVTVGAEMWRSRSYPGSKLEEDYQAEAREHAKL